MFPINGIQGMLSLLDMYSGDAEKQQECMNNIRQSSEYLFELVNNVLDMSMLESGEIELEHKPFNLQQLSEKVIALFEAQTKKKGVIISADCLEAEHQDLIGSFVHLGQIGNNILDNAVKFTNRGGTVSIGYREISCDGNTAVIEFRCRDTGIGMSKEFLEKAFDAFAQEDEKSARTSYQGTGLGLTLAKELIEKMNGTIRIESEKAAEPVFTLHLALK
ncbi:MAG: HAMP domain-containing sensor histidine kinase [Bacillota bacterium]|nr:HAMP domain-containing sensor histidine kinase [Bacillota bacterium]